MQCRIVLKCHCPADAVLSVVRSALAACPDLQTPRDIQRTLFVVLLLFDNLTFTLNLNVFFPGQWRKNLGELLRNMVWK